MTDEEKKAAEAKATADAAATAKAKAEADAKAKAEGTQAKDNSTEPEDGKEELDAEAAKKLIAELRTEAKERRLENKKLKEEQAKRDKALAILQGKTEADLDPVEKAKAASDAKMRNALIKAELASVARDAHEPGLLMSVAPSLFKDVTVDVEAEMVDGEELSAAVDKLRKSKPFLFQAKDATQQNGKSKKDAQLPLDKGNPTQGTNHHAVWKQLKEQGREGEAAAYYQKNRAEILAVLKVQ